MDPALGHLVDGHWVEVVKLLAAAPDGDHQRGLFQQLEVLGHGLAAHRQVFAKLGQRLPVVGVQSVEQQTASRTGECLENLVGIGSHGFHNMQPFGCMSRGGVAKVIVETWRSSESGSPHKRLAGVGTGHILPRNLPQTSVFRILNAMEVHFTPEQQARIAQIATKAGTAPERLVTDVVTRYLEEEARFLAAVEKGIAAAERGEFIEEEEMDARLEAMFKP
jgi:predicted transcriptional regulator